MKPLCDYDFIIVAAPRSGSHMLASALNGHPEITCEAEYDREAKIYLKGGTGKRGCIVPLNYVENNELNVDNVKVIILKRSPFDIAKSLSCMDKATHYLEPAKIEGKSAAPLLLRQCAEHAKRLKGLHGDFNCIVVSYEKLTDNIDKRELNLAVEICNFLGIKVLPLVPLTYKPEVSNG